MKYYILTSMNRIGLSTFTNKEKAIEALRELKSKLPPEQIMLWRLLEVEEIVV